LSALQAQGMIQSVVNNEGMIEAKGVEERDGKIFLLGADEVFNSGTLDASNTAAGKAGGTIHVLGDKVGLFDNAFIDASGDAGGGTILIGGDFQGANPEIQNAYRTGVGSNVVIKADATNTGNGGKVIIWADNWTKYYGTISATGGIISGDGGFAEVSGKDSLLFRGTVDLRAENGKIGTLLLDPADLTISAVTTDDAQISDQTLLSGDACTGNPCLISAAEIVTQLNTASVSLAATNSITVSSAIDASANANSFGLTLNAPTINLGANITLNNGNLVLTGAVVLTSTVALNTGTGAGNISLSSTVNGAFGLTLTAGTGTTTLSGIVGGVTPLTSFTLSSTGNTGSVNFGTITTNGNIQITTTGDIAIIDGAFNAGAGNISLESSNGSITDSDVGTAASITTTGTVALKASSSIGGTATDAAIDIASSTNLTVDANQNIVVTSGGTLADLTITLDPGGTGTYSITDGNLTLTLTDSGTNLTIGGLTLSSGNLNFVLKVDTGNVTTSGAINVGTGSFTATTTSGNQTYSGTVDAGSISMTSSGNLMVSNTITSSGGVSISASGSLTVDSTKQIKTTGSADLTVSAVGITLNGSSSGTENLQANGTGGISITSTGAISLMGDFAIGLANTGTLTIDAGTHSISTTGSGSNPDIFLSGGAVNIKSGAFGLFNSNIRTSGLTTLAMSTSGGIYITNTGGTNINSSLINSIDGIVASSGNIEITNTASGGGFIFTRIILASTGNITLKSDSTMSDGNATATSISATNGSVTLVSNSGSIGSGGNPIEVTARSLSATASSSVNTTFTNTTLAAATDETAADETTPPVTCTAALAAQGVCTFTGTCTAELAAAGICTSPDVPTPPDRIPREDIIRVFGAGADSDKINADNNRGRQSQFVQDIGDIVNKPGC